MIHTETVKEAMKDKRLSASDLAGKLGVHEQTVSGWLGGFHSPSPAYEREIQHALGLTWHELSWGRK